MIRLQHSLQLQLKVIAILLGFGKNKLQLATQITQLTERLTVDRREKKKLNPAGSPSAQNPKYEHQWL